MLPLLFLFMGLAVGWWFAWSTAPEPGADPEPASAAQLLARAETSDSTSPEELRAILEAIAWELDEEGLASSAGILRRIQVDRDRPMAAAAVMAAGIGVTGKSARHLDRAWALFVRREPRRSRGGVS